LSALVVGRHERFSAQGSTPARDFDSPSLTTSPTWGIAPLSVAATGAMKAKQPLDGMVISSDARHNTVSAGPERICTTKGVMVLNAWTEAIKVLLVGLGGLNMLEQMTARLIVAVVYLPTIDIQE
jgi:hypothetical protein